MYRLPANVYHGTPARQSSRPVHDRDMESPSEILVPDRGAGPLHTLVLNSTVHQLPEQQAPSALPPRLLTDKPAKVFARLKAKVEQQNFKEFSDVAQNTQMDNSNLLHLKMQQSQSDDTFQEGLETYVLLLSPPKSQNITWQVGDSPLTANSVTNVDEEREGKGKISLSLLGLDNNSISVFTAIRNVSITVKSLLRYFDIYIIHRICR